MFELGLLRGQVDINLDKMLIRGEPLSHPGAQPPQEKNHRQVCQTHNLSSYLRVYRAHDMV